MTRLRTRLVAAMAVTALSVTALAVTGGTAQALSNPANPALTYDHIISTHPFASSALNASDIEGLGYVPSDNSMWVADDNADSVWEINPTTGAYKSRLGDGVSGLTDFESATKVGSGETCTTYVDPAVAGDTAHNECLSRTDDFESVVYDPVADVLYVTSGNCCGAGLPAGYPYHPTVWKLTRVAGHFVPTQWQPLAEGQDPTAAGWRPGSGIYYGKGSTVGPYTFGNTARDSTFKLPVSNIVGLDFTDANTVFVTTASVNTATNRTTATSDSTIHRFNISGSNWTEDTSWTFPLKNIGGTAAGVDDNGMIDARDLAIVGDKFYVSDGYDYRASADHPIYVYNLTGATASFVAVPTTGNRPLTVGFFDSSTGNPISWAWDFDNNGTTDATSQIASHTYPSAGTYTAKLTVGYAGGGSASATQLITVKVPTGTPGGYILDGFGGLHPVRVGNGAMPAGVSGNPYWPGWDIARGVSVLPNGTGGYEVDGFGGIHPFAVGSNTRPSGRIKGGGYWPGWDIARSIALMPNGRSGYMLDGFGGIHPFAIGSAALPPKIIGNPYWLGQDMARGIMLTSDGKGGYVVDRTGKLYKFKVTGGARPADANTVAIVTAVQMQGGSFIADNTGGFTVDGFGGTHGFGVGASGPPPRVSYGPYWPGWDIARDISLFTH